MCRWPAPRRLWLLAEHPEWLSAGRECAASSVGERVNCGSRHVAELGARLGVVERVRQAPGAHLVEDEQFRLTSDAAEHGVGDRAHV